MKLIVLSQYQPSPLMHHTMPCRMQSLFLFLQILHNRICETKQPWIRFHLKLLDGRSCPLHSPNSYLDAIFPRDILHSWIGGRIADCFFLIEKFSGGPSHPLLTGGKLIKVLHFQIYWKCLALSIALSKRELRNTKQSTKQKRASYRHPLNWEKIVPRQGECLNPIPSLHSLTC